MARQRSPNRERAFEIWEASGRSVKLKDIAAQLGVSESQIRKWKNQDQWDKVMLPKKKSNVTKNRRGAPIGNQNAVGNKGGSAPPENKNAEKHGFFSKWLPPETLEIMQEIEERSALDLLWDQIVIQYTAIIRAQKLMFVRDQHDKTVEMVQESELGTKYEIQQAWDKHANFLAAQSRAMATLNSLIKQYEDMLQRDEDREDIAEERRQRIAKLQAEVSRIETDKGTGIGSVVFAGEGDLVD